MKKYGSQSKVQTRKIHLPAYRWKTKECVRELKILQAETSERDIEDRIVMYFKSLFQTCSDSAVTNDA